MANKYKWFKTNIVLQRLVDNACIPWPPGESEGFKAQKEIDAGEVVLPEDPIDPQIAIDKVRTDAIDLNIKNDAVLNAAKAMTNAQFDTWWAANVTNLAQANGVLKLLARIVIRKLL
jgi:hypothetical protein